MADENKPAFYPRVGNIKAKNFKPAKPMPFVDDERAMDLPQYGDVDLSVPSKENLELSRRMAERDAQLRRQQQADRSPLEKLAGGVQAGRFLGSALTQAINSAPTRLFKGDEAADKFMQERMYKPEQPTAYEYAGDVGNFLEKLETEYKIPPVLPEAVALQYLTGPATSQAMRTAGRGAEQAGRKIESAMEPVVKGAFERGGLPREMVMAMGQGTASNLDVWHGSPHKFKPTAKNPLGEFDATKMGTGEGAQAYGIGHYTAEAKDVAKTYQPRSPEYEEKLLSLYDKAQRQRNHPMMEVLEDAMLHRDPEEILAKFANTEDGYTPQHIKAAQDFATWYENNPPEVGGLYKVDLSDEAILKMLDLDKPLSEQNESVKAVLLNHPDVLEHIAKSDQQRMRLNESHPVRLEKIPSAANPYDATRMTGSDVMSAIAQRSGMGERGAVEKQLKELGIPGIKYLDEGSRGATGSGKWQITNKDGTTSIMDFKPNDDVLESMGATASPYGTRNFVVFPGNEDLMNIIDRKKAGGKVSISNNPDTMMLEVNNQKMKNGVPAYSGAGLIKGGLKAAKPPKIEVPIRFPVSRGPTVPEIRAMAERMAPQVMGEFVRAAPTPSKPNPSESVVGKSRKQFEREKTLPIEYENIKEPVTPEEFDYAKKKGALLIGAQGDVTPGNRMLISIDNQPLSAPVHMQAGPEWELYNPSAWAATDQMAKTWMKRAKKASEEYEADPYLHYHKMTPDANWYAMHHFNSILGHLRPEELKLRDPKLYQEMLEEIRTKDVGFGKHPEFEGFDDPLNLQIHAQMDPNFRRHIGAIFGGPKFTTRYGLNSGQDVLAATSLPELRDLEAGASGYAVVPLDVNAPLRNFEADSQTYDTGFPKAGASGRSKYPSPYQLIYRDTLNWMKDVPSDKKSSEFGRMNMIVPKQQIDNELIEAIGEYQRRMKELTGKKKGGAVKKAEGGYLKKPAAYINGDEFVNAAKKYGIKDSMNNLNKIVDLVNKGLSVDDAARQVADTGMHKAAGGAISGDDLILEERPL